MIHLKSQEEIETIARGGAIIAAFIDAVEARVRPGVTTADLDAFADDFIRSHAGAVPAFKGLYGFPGSICTSVNEEVVHGIPCTSRVLQEGDIVSLDVGVRLDGWCSDSAWTFRVGDVDQATESLLDRTRAALDAAVEAAQPGNHVGDIGAAVIASVAGSSFAIIRELVGHGVGREVHEEPQVPNVGRAGYGPMLRKGMVLAIEPMLSAGSDIIRTLEDQWTVVTSDGARSAHYEHTVAITDGEPRILTAPAADPGLRGDEPAVILSSSAGNASRESNHEG